MLVSFETYPDKGNRFVEGTGKFGFENMTQFDAKAVTRPHAQLCEVPSFAAPYLKGSLSTAAIWTGEPVSFEEASVIAAT